MVFDLDISFYGVCDDQDDSTLTRQKKDAESNWKAQITNIKVIRNKQTGFSEGYRFVELNSHATAEKALQDYAGAVMPDTDQPFRLNWASFSTGDKRAADSGSDHSNFVGDLAADVTDSLLLKTFSSKYPSVKAAKVVIDVNTGRSKGYGFVRFGDDGERTQAMTEMNGVYCSSRPMRTGAATPRKTMGYQQEKASQCLLRLKDPKKPKRPPSAFFGFMKTFKVKQPNNKLVAAVGKAADEKWKSMSVAVKSKK